MSKWFDPPPSPLPPVLASLQRGSPKGLAAAMRELVGQIFDGLKEMEDDSEDSDFDEDAEEALQLRNRFSQHIQYADARVASRKRRKEQHDHVLNCLDEAAASAKRRRQAGKQPRCLYAEMDTETKAPKRLFVDDAALTEVAASLAVELCGRMYGRGASA